MESKKSTPYIEAFISKLIFNVIQIIFLPIICFNKWCNFAIRSLSLNIYLIYFIPCLVHFYLINAKHNTKWINQRLLVSFIRNLPLLRKKIHRLIFFTFFKSLLVYLRYKMCTFVKIIYRRYYKTRYITK